MRHSGLREIPVLAVSVSGAALVYLMASRAPLPDATAMPMKAPAKVRTLCTDTPEPFQVQLDPVSIEQTGDGSRLDLDATVQNDLETSMAVAVSYVLWDDTGQSVRTWPSRAADARVISRGASGSFAAEIPGGLKPGYYRLQALALGLDSAEKSRATAGNFRSPLGLVGA